MLDISHNLLTVQQTYFVHPDYTTTSIYGYLDLSENKIRKFELMPASVEISILPYVGVLLQRKWLYTDGNSVLSIL